MDELRELLTEAWEHRGDTYWWLDHMVLQAILLALATGLVGLAVKYAELRMVNAMKGGVDAT